MDPDRVSISVNVEAHEAETRTLMGQEYTVLPATLVREQVLHNNLGRTFLPAEAITESWAEMANDTPAVLDHPTSRGAEVSARDPGVLNAAGIGRLYHVEAADGELKGEVWLREDRAEDVDGLDVVLDRVAEGEPVEISTGFPVAVERDPGVYNEQEYDLVLQPLGFDHLAVFVDQVGACSVDDGCGLGVNAEADQVAEGLWDRLLKFFEGATTAENQDEMSLDDIRRAVRDHLDEEFGAQDRFVFIEELFEDEVVYAIEERGGEDRLFRASYEIDEDGEVTLGDRTEVEKVTEFVPVENRIEPITDYRALVINCGGCDMTREELIEALADNEDAPFDADALEEMDEDQLATVANGAGVDAPEASAEDEEDTDDADAPTADNEGEEPPSWASELLETTRRNADRLDELEEATEPVREEAEQERRRLASEVAQNSDFCEEELENKPVAELRKLQKMSRGRRFVGRRGPKRPATSGDGVDVEVRNIMSGPRGEAAIDEDEKS